MTCTSVTYGVSWTSLVSCLDTLFVQNNFSSWVKFGYFTPDPDAVKFQEVEQKFKVAIDREIKSMEWNLWTSGIQ